MNNATFLAIASLMLPGCDELVDWWPRGSRIRSIVGALLLAVLARGGALSAQDSFVQVDGEAGILLMREAFRGSCGGYPAGLMMGLVARGGGALGVSAAADLLLSGVLGGGGECIDVGPVGDRAPWRYGRTSYRPGLRVRAGLGYALPLTRTLRTELGAGVGILPTTTEYGATSSDPRTTRTGSSLEPWYGGFLKVKSTEQRVGFKAEVGRHRLPHRVYVFDEDELLAERVTWHWLVSVGVSVALID